LFIKTSCIYPDPAKRKWIFSNDRSFKSDGTPHESNGRATIDDDDNDFWFGFEQEYFIMDTATQLPLGLSCGGYPGPQGMYYCSVGGRNTHGRHFVEEHADLCIAAGLNFEGINQEVASGQWEFQLFAKGAKKAGDEMWIARYLLDRLLKDMDIILNITQSQLKVIGMVVVCMLTFQILYLELVDLKKHMKKYVKPLDQL
jgi:glutamine synthetase